MAANNKSATNRKTTAQKTTVRGSDSFPKAYMRLRTVLDAVEVNALRYCLKDESATRRKERAREIERLLMPILEVIKGKPVEPIGTGNSCGDGFYNCGGVCVPYQCPGNSD